MAFRSRSKTKPAPIDRERSLAAVPVLNGGVQVTEGRHGNVELVVRTPRGSSFFARFQPPVMQKVCRLDELGSFVFRQVDGRRSVLDIVTQFREHYRANRREAELSTVAFLRSLAQRRILSIVIR